MVQILVVFCHPCKQSLNLLVKDTLISSLRTNHTITETILYETYDPSSPSSISQECDKVSSSRVIIFQFPVYYVSFPALLHSWVLSVIMPRPSLIASKKILISATLGGTHADYSVGGARGSLDLALSPYLTHIFHGAILLQPYLLFSNVFNNGQSLHEKLELLVALAADLDNWPVKHLPLESWLYN